MYNQYRSVKTEGVFVYALTNNGIVFYVGISSFVSFRYKQHFVEMPCAAYIKQMRIKGNHPGLVILGIFDDIKEAKAAEHSTIRCLSYLGNKLLNNHQNPVENKLDYNSIEIIDKPKTLSANKFTEILETALKDYTTFRLWQRK